MPTVRYIRDVRHADTCGVWVTVRVAATAAVLGAGMVAASVHGHGAAAPAAHTALSTTVTYQPPRVALPAPAADVRVLPRSVARPAPRTTRRTTHPAVRPAAPNHAAPPATSQPVHHAAPVSSYSSALQAAVARIPTYRAGTVRWVVSRAYAFWGTADWYHGVLYVSPDVPRSKLYDVAVHEWSHELSVLDYAGDVAAATKAMNAWFGGSDLVGPERAADCMSILQGATWTHYTTCTDAHWRAGARLLVTGQRL